MHQSFTSNFGLTFRVELVRRLVFRIHSFQPSRHSRKATAGTICHGQKNNLTDPPQKSYYKRDSLNSQKETTTWNFKSSIRSPIS